MAKGNLQLDGGIMVKVSRMSERLQLRAAAIFDPKVVEDIQNKRISNADAIDLWVGNEAYLMFIIENSVKLIGTMPTSDEWLRPLVRNHRAYRFDPRDVEDPDFKQALYIRHIGMTTDEHIKIVTDIAMGTAKAKPVQIPASKQIIDADEEEEDEE